MADVPFGQLLERARALADRPGRAILGITGPPAAGKSTLAQRLREELGAAAAYVPLDGFHLAHQLLVVSGLVERKGAPDTFDAAGYVALLRRLRDPAEGAVYAPRFDRDIEDSIANATPVPPDVPLVITEGNYLLLRSGPWAQVAGLLDEVWYIDLAEETRLRRLISRPLVRVTGTLLKMAPADQPAHGIRPGQRRGPGPGHRVRSAERGAHRGRPGLREPGRVGGPQLNFVAAKQAAEGAAGQRSAAAAGDWSRRQ